MGGAWPTGGSVFNCSGHGVGRIKVGDRWTGSDPRRPWTSGRCVCVCLLVSQSCLTLCGHVDHSPPGSCVHRILQLKRLECVDIPPSGRSS